jgi:hypothetical protein
MSNALAVSKQTTKVRDRHCVQAIFLAKPKFLQPILMEIIKKLLSKSCLWIDMFAPNIITISSKE